MSIETLRSLLDSWRETSRETEANIDLGFLLERMIDQMDRQEDRLPPRKLLKTPAEKKRLS